MAAPIPLKLRPRDPREALYHRLEEAPREHVEALLTAYEVLQGLHDRGVLELLRGALGSSDKVLQILVDAANKPEVIRGMRNLMILARIADTLEPELLEGLATAVPEGLAQAKKPEPLGFWQLLEKECSQNTPPALTAKTRVLESVGKRWAPESKRAHKIFRKLPKPRMGRAQAIQDQKTSSCVRPAQIASCRLQPIMAKSNRSGILSPSNIVAFNRVAGPGK